MQVTVVGRAVHAPWNEGTRVIARNIGLALRSGGYPTHAISLSEPIYLAEPDPTSAHIEHIASSTSHATAADYRHMARMVQAIKQADRGAGSSVVHAIGSPLALGPFVRRPTRRFVAHIPLSQQAYLPSSERLRAALGWRLFDRWVDAYACTSQRIVEALLRQGYPAAKLHVVEPPLDVQFFKPVDRATARRQLGFDPSAFVVVYVGTVSPLRFPAEEIMQALNSAASTIPKLVLEVFAPHATHTYNVQWSEDNVGRAVQGSDVPVHMHLQDLTEHEKTIVYSAADVVILPFKAPVAVEPPLTALEAMACETITAVAPAANRSNIVEDGVNGYTWDSSASLTACLVRIYHLSPERRAALGREGRASVMRRFSYETIVGAIENVWSAIGVHPDNRLG